MFVRDDLAHLHMHIMWILQMAFVHFGVDFFFYFCQGFAVKKNYEI